LWSLLIVFFIVPNPANKAITNPWKNARMESSNRGKLMLHIFRTIIRMTFELYQY